jgi:ribosomal protein S14
MNNLLLYQTGYSNKLNYFFYKNKQLSFFYTKIRGHCLLSARRGAVISNIKLSRISLSKKISNGFVTGYFKSIWYF